LRARGQASSSSYQRFLLKKISAHKIKNSNSRNKDCPHPSPLPRELPCTHKSFDQSSLRPSPPKSPILGDFEMKRGFRGQAIYLAQSPPILMSHCVGRVPRLKASDVGDLGDISRLKRIYGTCVYTVARRRGNQNCPKALLPREKGWMRVN
jgi:hypothetical protein